MKPANALAIVTDMRLALQHALWPTLRDAVRAPRALAALFFAHVWAAFGDGVDANARAEKEALLAHARGVVLDVGAGHGHTARYLDRGRVTQYIALEPNGLMHGALRAAAAAAGFAEADGTLRVLGCGAEDLAEAAGDLAGGVDTLVCVMALCSVPRPARTLRGLVGGVLRGGGALLFYEHVASARADVRFWQRFWTPLWKVLFGGCELDRPTDAYVRALDDVWEAYPGADAGGRTGIWGKAGDDEENLFWHQVGRLVKRGAGAP